MASSNFAPLEPHSPAVAAIGRKAESVFANDPHGAIGHLRRFAEALTLELLDHHGLLTFGSQFERLQRLQHESPIDRGALDVLHDLRRLGNRAVHEAGAMNHATAIGALRSAARVAAWYWRTYTDQTGPKPMGFVKPRASNPRTEDRILKAALEAERRAKQQAEAAVEELERRLQMPEVAIHQSLELAYRDLGEDQRATASRFLREFRSLPLDPRWPLVEIPADDAKVRRVRASGLTFIVVAPERGDILLVVFVAADDAFAQRWASTRRFEVNTALGTLQVFDPTEVEEAADGLSGGLLAAHTDDALLQIGLPQVLIPAVRAVSAERELDALCPLLPPEAADALYLLACGYDLEQTLAELDRRQPVEVDAEDFAAAVHHPESKRSFLVLSGDEDLDAMLEGSLEAWRTFLHPDQEKLVRMQANGPVRVLGGAGTGKTVALLHRAAHLLREVHTGPSDRILVTTFTRNLASDLRHQLARMLTSEELRRVDVVHFHAVVSDLWKTHGDGRPLARKGELDRAKNASYSRDSLGRSARFYDEEWEQVVVAHDLDTELAYLRVRRSGRGESLSRTKRRQVWKVFDALRRHLDLEGVVTAAGQMRLLRDGLESGRIPRRYCSVLVDEAQDFGVPELELLRALAPVQPNDLFLVGDAHQRIYGRPVPMSRCGIEIRGRSRRLRVNYRTTARVRAWAVHALQGESFDDLDGGVDTLDGYRSLREGIEPEVVQLDSRDAELAHILATVERWAATNELNRVGIGAPSSAKAAEIAAFLDAEGIATVMLKTDASVVGDGVRIGTFHRLKGLEFPLVLLSSVQQGLMPLRTRGFYDLDAAAQADWDQRQRCLLYVAATRARDELVVTGCGKAPTFLTRGA